jgi:hypothetical protein
MEKLRVITVPLNEEAIFDLSYYGIKQYYNNPKDRVEIWNV